MSPAPTPSPPVQVGYNHNVPYRGELFHVQTEDSGAAAPHIITLLYLGGTILRRTRCDYGDVLQTPDLAERVRRMMQQQHKEMMRALIHGQLDAAIAARKSLAVPPGPSV